jgi:Na+-driven multidrug efflux pump
MLTIAYTVAMGLSIGVTAMVARRIGEKNPEGAAEAAVQGIALGVIVAAIIGVAGALLAPNLLAVMGASPTVIATGQTYTRIMLGGNIVILLLFLINAMFRGAGDAAIAMRVLWLANWINIILGPLLIFGVGPFPKLGVTGAAIATTIGRGTGVLYQLYRLWRRDGRIVIHGHQIQLKPAVMKTMLRLSGTGTFQVFVGMASWIGLTRINASFGTDALAGLSDRDPHHHLRAVAVVGSRQRRGHDGRPRRWARANRSVAKRRCGRRRSTTSSSSASPGSCSSRSRIRSRIYSRTIRPSRGSRPTACASSATGICSYAYGMVLTNSFNGAGDTWTPTWLNLFCFWLWEIPLAYVLARHFEMGPAAWRGRSRSRSPRSRSPASCCSGAGAGSLR